MAFFKEIRHYFSIFFGFMQEFLVALNVSFSSIIEKGLPGKKSPVIAIGGREIVLCSFKSITYFKKKFVSSHHHDHHTIVRS